MSKSVKPSHFNAKPQSGGGKVRLTTADLVVLSVLLERSMHGYEVHATLERRQVRDWAEVSKAQIYYSLDKLVRLDLIEELSLPCSSLGPERKVFQANQLGQSHLQEALTANSWTQTRSQQPFLTWLALSWQASPEAALSQLERRRAHLLQTLAIEKDTLESVRAEVGHDYHEAVWMLTLVMEQLELELKWLERVQQQWPMRRPAAKKPRPAKNKEERRREGH